MDAAWLTAFIALATAVGALIVWCGRWAIRILMRTTRFLDDYFGEPARAGVDGRPGVMARLQALEAGLAKVLAETRPDHGHSLRDVVHRAAADVADTKDQVTRLAGRVEQIEHARERRESSDG